MVEHPLAQHALTVLRDRATPNEAFRTVSKQLLMMLALEATRSLPVRDEEIDAGGMVHSGKVLAKPVVFLSVSRHSMGLSHNLAELIPGLHVGSVSLDTSADNRRPQVRLNVFNSPALADVRVVLFDPVISTGLSCSLALNLIRRSGAADIALVNFVTSSQGLSRLMTGFPDLMIYTTGIDSNWDSKRGPLPGIFQFAERMYEK